jgi:hypothetical protein
MPWPALSSAGNSSVTSELAKRICIANRLALWVALEHRHNSLWPVTHVGQTGHPSQYWPLDELQGLKVMLISCSMPLQQLAILLHNTNMRKHVYTCTHTLVDTYLHPITHIRKHTHTHTHTCKHTHTSSHLKGPLGGAVAVPCPTRHSPLRLAASCTP